MSKYALSIIVTGSHRSVALASRRIPEYLLGTRLLPDTLMSVKSEKASNYSHIKIFTILIYYNSRFLACLWTLIKKY